MEQLLDFELDIDDTSLEKRITNLSYSSRSLQLQQIVECLPKSIADEIISYELSRNSVMIFIRRSMVHNVLNKINLNACIMQWTLTFIGFYLFLSGLNLFGLFVFIPSEKFVYFIGNYTEMGWRIELSIVIALCTVHFSQCLYSYISGRKWQKKLNRVKKTLHFADAENCGEAYIPVLNWLGFPFVEAFNLDLKWFFLMGFKYWIMICIFTVLCLPFYVFETNFFYVIVSIPACILCCLGAWLQLVTFQNRNSICLACKDLLKILVMCVIVFSILYGIIWLMNTRKGSAESGDHDTEDVLERFNIFHGNFDILNLVLASMFVVILICVQLRIIFSWESVNVRYHYFGWQLLSSILIVMIFGVLDLNLMQLVSASFVLYNAAIIWNDLMHKKIMKTTYGLSKAQYVDKYRPIYNTDKDSEWLTAPYQLCCFKKTISKCRGRWVINCYAGLVTGRITTPTYLL